MTTPQVLNFHVPRVFKFRMPLTVSVDLVHTGCRFALYIWISRAERQTPGAATLRDVLAER